MRIYHTIPHRKRQRRGTIIAFFLVIVGLLVTGLITSVAVSSVTGTQTANLTLKRDRAFYAAESGIQHVIWKVRYGGWANNNFPPFSGTAGGATYDVSVLHNNGLGTVVVRSVGQVPNQNAPISVTITTTLSGCGYPLPTIALGGSFNGSGGNRVSGNMMVYGDITQSGNFTVVGGNVYATGYIQSTNVKVDPGYGVYPNTPVPPPPNVETIANALRSTTGARKFTKTDMSASNFKLDFTQSPSKILYYEDNQKIQDWRDPPVVGDGTLVVFNDVGFKSARSFVGHNVNIVVVGKLEVQPGAQFDLQGSLYVKGNIQSQSQFNVQGVILCNGNMQTAGQGSDIAQLPPPDFDPRVSALSQEEVVIGAFTGPIF
ncbi:MAG: hypothetical protein FWD53_04895 [Phycisphaerales bacterium]|nr:hypothetical protein [Phycisphaerales bacterium]